jgi:hypothetical protein
VFFVPNLSVLCLGLNSGGLLGAPVFLVAHRVRAMAPGGELTLTEDVFKL